jgi:hypothetical protein
MFGKVLNFISLILVHKYTIIPPVFPTVTTVEIRIVSITIIITIPPHLCFVREFLRVN